MKSAWLIFPILGCLAVPPAPAAAQDSEAPQGLARERSLPSRYPFVVQDALKYCKPDKGFWIDLGAGKGQVALALIEAAGNPVVMLDPNAEAMNEGLRAARDRNLQDRLFAVVGSAEKMPFPDEAADARVASAENSSV